MPRYVTLSVVRLNSIELSHYSSSYIRYISDYCLQSHEVPTSTSNLEKTSTSETD